MSRLFNVIAKIFNDNSITKKESNDFSDEEIIETYNKMKELGVIPNNEPNYELAKKVFLDFNDFNLVNTENKLTIYLDYIPKSLLPYPKNYIKYAYYLFLEKLEKEGNEEMRKNVESIGILLFTGYPDYEKYKKNLPKKKVIDEALKDLKIRETFKRIYGVYEVSEEDYNSSPSSTDVTKERLYNDFGVLLKIEDDIEM